VSSNKIIARPKIFAAMVCRNGIDSAFREECLPRACEASRRLRF